MNRQFDVSIPQFFPGNIGSPLNILYNDFAESTEHDNAKVIALTKDLRRMLQNMPAECANDVMDQVALICVEHQREGFFAGVRTGVELISEISK